jgi:hypothetical protein
MESASAALEQWRQLAQQLKSSKRPRTNQQLMRRYAGILEEVLDSAAPLDQVVPDLHLLPNGVVGMAFGATSNRLTPQLQRAISTWISNQDQERGDVERVYALPGLLGSAPSDAFSTLCSMRISPTPTKDQRERLAAELCGIPADAIAQMFSDQKEHEMRKVIVLLLIAAQEAKADRQTRAAILEAVVPVTVQLSLHRGSPGIELRKHMQAVLESVDGLSLKRVQESLRGTEASALHDLLGGALPIAQPKPEPTCGDSEPKAEPLAHPRKQTANDPPLDTKPDPLAWFDANIQMLAHARQFYLAARSEADLERKRREETESMAGDHSRLTTMLLEAEARLSALEQQLAVATRARDLVAAELKTATQNLETERQMRQTRDRELLEANETFSREREGLQRRIDTNAEARVRDFRIAIAAAIAPLLRDVPSPGSERASELGPGLLVCIDQIIRALTERGIELKRASGERS